MDISIKTWRVNDEIVIGEGLLFMPVETIWSSSSSLLGQDLYIRIRNKNIN